tara:strand:+ start:46 stop:444 length:399 start_codon:yes stop_codon:yes gene_type:complete
MTSSQKNIIETCGNVKGVSQENLKKERGQCMIGSVIDSNLDQTSDTKSSFTADVQSFVENHTLEILGVVVIIVLCIAGYIYYKKVIKNKDPSSYVGDKGALKADGGGYRSFIAKNENYLFVALVVLAILMKR